MWLKSCGVNQTRRMFTGLVTKGRLVIPPYLYTLSFLLHSWYSCILLSVPCVYNTPALFITICPLPPLVHPISYPPFVPSHLWFTRYPTHHLSPPTFGSPYILPTICPLPPLVHPISYPPFVPSHLWFTRYPTHHLSPPTFGSPLVHPISYPPFVPSHLWFTLYPTHHLSPPTFGSPYILPTICRFIPFLLSSFIALLNYSFFSKG